MIVTLWALLLLHAALAQQPVRIGPALGYEFGVPLTADRSAGNVNRFGAPGSGASYNHTFSFGAQLAFPGSIASWIDPVFRLSLGVSSGRFTSDQFRAGLIIDPADPANDIPIMEQFGLYSTLSVVQLDMPFEVRLDDPLRMGIGPWLSYRFSSGYIETLSIVSPDTTVLPNATRQWVAGGGEQLGSNALRGGGLVSIALPIALSGRVLLQPELHVRIDAGALIDGFGARALAAGAGIALLFDPAADSTPPPPDIPPRDAVDSAARTLQASIDIYCDDSSQTAIMRMERTRHVNAMPLLPVVFFDRGSAEIPERFAAITAAAAATFTRNSLAQLDPLSLYHQTLNVIGMRMRAAPASSIVLRGSASDDEPVQLGSRRAERVRGYLADVWGIAPARVAIEPAGRSSGSHAAEARAVTITSGTGDVLDPIVAEWIVREWHVPQVGLRRSITGGADVKSWTITVRRGAEVLARYASVDGDRTEDLGGAFQMPQGNAMPEPFVAELTVIDMAGRVATALDTLPVIRAAADAAPPIIHEALAYSFLGDSGNDELLRRLGESVRSGAHIAVADLPGEQNRKWSAARTGGRLLDIIGSTKRLGEMRIGGVAADTALPSGDSLPETSLLTSGARVTVEQGAGD